LFVSFSLAIRNFVRYTNIATTFYFIFERFPQSGLSDFRFVFWPLGSGLPQGTQDLIVSYLIVALPVGTQRIRNCIDVEFCILYPLQGSALL
jgi:hypothetical protein